MDIHQLRYFLCFCDEMNYTIAAEKAFVTRQALSQSIKSLERELNTTLIHEKNGRLALTDQGERFRIQSQEVVHQFDSLKQQFQRKETVGLKLGVSNFLLPFVFEELPLSMKKFMQRHSEVVLKINELPNDQVWLEVKQGKLDAGILVWTPEKAAGISSELLQEKTIYASVSKKCCLSEKKKLTRQDLTLVPLFIPGEAEKVIPELWRDCRKEKSQIHYQILSNSHEGCLKISNEDAVFLDVSCDAVGYSYKTMPLEDGKYCWHFCLITRSEDKREELKLLQDHCLKSFYY